MNTSKVYRKNADHIRDVMSSVQHEIIGAIIGLTGILGLWLNAGLLVKIRKQIHKDVLIANLAISNIGLCVFAFPFSSTAAFQHEWTFGDKMCTYYGFISLFFGFVMMTSVAMIAIDEYFLFDYGPYVNKRSKVNKWMILYSWINSLFWSVTPLVGWTRFGYEPSGTSCTVVYYPNEGYTSYMIGCFAACYLIPMIALCYCKLRYRIVDPTKRTKNVSLSRRTMMLMISFLFCWTPYTIVYLWPIFTTQDVSFTLSVLAPAIAKMHTIITPIIFLNTNDEIFKVE